MLATAACGGSSRHRHPDGFGGATWSRRSGSLAYVASWHDQGPPGIYLVRAGRRPLRLTSPGFDAWSPAWSPDGRWIAYAAGRAVPHPFTQAADDLFLVSADGRRHIRLTRTREDESGPSWAPDGRRIAYVRGGRIFVIAIKNKVSHALTAGSDSDPQWAPNGRWIAYIHGRFGTGDLMLIRPDGTGKHLLAGPVADCPRWSPDGRRIAYRLAGAVQVVGVGGGPALAPPSAAASGYSCDYAWSPDGSALVVAGLTTEGDWQLETIALASFHPHSLVRVPYDPLGPDLEPAWTPSRTIVFGGDFLRSVDPSTGSLKVLVSAVRP